MARKLTTPTASDPWMAEWDLTALSQDISSEADGSPVAFPPSALDGAGGMTLVVAGDSSDAEDTVTWALVLVDRALNTVVDSVQWTSVPTSRRMSPANSAGAYLHEGESFQGVNLLRRWSSERNVAAYLTVVDGPASGSVYLVGYHRVNRNEMV